MPVIVSREKQVRKTNKKRLNNRMGKNQVRTVLKQLEVAVSEKDTEKALALRNVAFKLLDRSFTSKTLKKNTVNRLKSKISHKINAIALD